jgi:4-hydroxybenzoate polyprenyltransferase
VAWPPIVLGAAVMLWVSGFDIIYACQDFDFDLKMRLHSIPARCGIARALRIAAALHCGMLVLLAVLPSSYPEFGWIYYSGVAAIAILLTYEHAIVRPDDLTRVNQAFFHVNAVVSIGLLAIGALDLLV